MNPDPTGHESLLPANRDSDKSVSEAEKPHPCE